MIQFQLTRIIPCDVRSVPNQFKPQLNAADQQETPVMRALGRTADGRAVNCYVTGFFPYFYVAAPQNLTPELAPPVLESLHTRIERETGMRLRSLELLYNQFTDASGYRARPRSVLKVTLHDPSKVPKVRDMWLSRYAHCGGFRHKDYHFEALVWEADVKFHTRLGLDIGAVPYCWIDAPTTCQDDGRSDRRIALHCDETLVCHYSELVVHPPNGEYMRNAPLVTVSFDIECIGRPGLFPEAQHDQVSQIACCTYTVTNCAPDALPAETVIFTTGTSTLRFEDHRHVIQCDTEEDLLMEFSRYLVGCRPDFVTGYNVDKFDWPYLLERAQVLGLARQFAALNRAPGRQVIVKANEFESKAFGASEGFNVVADWESDDMMRNIQKAHKLRSYKLDAVAAEFLKDNKKPLHHKLIREYHYGTEEQQLLLWEYCIHDALLAARLFFQQKTLLNQIEMARVTGVDVDTLVTGGQQVKTHRLICADARANGMIVPTMAQRYADRDVLDADDEPESEQLDPKVKKARERMADGKRKTVFSSTSGRKKKSTKTTKGYEGATVLDPIRGYYEHPITTLDFSSLYPSIMIQHNLCYSTLLPVPIIIKKRKLPDVEDDYPDDDDLAAMAVSTADDNCNYCSDQDYRCGHGHCMCCSQASVDCGCVKHTPHDDRFVHTSVREGILPRILRNILAARAVAKKDMNAEQDPEVKAVYDGRQNALKITANSVYGFTGATKGKLPCIPISASVTAYGRTMIMFVKNLVEKKYQGKGAVQSIECLRDVVFAAKVIYGDTDSVMVLFGGTTVEQGIEAGKHAAEYINASFAAMWLRPHEQRALIDEFISPEFQGSIQDALDQYTDTFCKQVLARAKSVVGIVFEKVLWKYLLINKKRYAGGFWVSPTKMLKVHQSGLESVRRDNCEFASQLVGDVIKILMKQDAQGDMPKAALKHAHKQIQSLLRGEVEIDQLTITRGFNKRVEEYADASIQPHLIVNKKRAQRDPGSEYQMGDRIPYVMAVTPDVIAKKKQLLKVKHYVEDPDYVLENKMMLYYDYYIEHQIRKPITRIFDAIYGDQFSDQHLFAPSQRVVTAKPVDGPIKQSFGISLIRYGLGMPKPDRELDVDRAVQQFKDRPKQTSIMSFFVGGGGGAKRRAVEGS